MNYRLASFFLVIVVLFLAVLLFVAPKPSNSIIVDGIVLAGRENPGSELIALSEAKTFIVSPAFYENHSINPYTANAMNLFIVVLNGNDRNAVQLIRVFNPDKTLKYCATNFGNELTQENLSSTECLGFISSSVDAVKVFIEFPDSAREMARVEVSGDTVTIRAKSFNDVGKTGFVVLRVMFENAEEILRKTNLLVEKLLV